MMLPTHLMATMLVGLILARWLGWTPATWMLALAFGVGVDVDHLFVLPAYYSAHQAMGTAALAPTAFAAYGGGWHSFFHVPVGAQAVWGLSVHERTPVPILFLGLHKAMDWPVGKVMTFGGPAEWAILAALTLGVVVLARAHVRARWPGLAPTRWLAGWTLALAPAPVRRALVAARAAPAKRAVRAR